MKTFTLICDHRKQVIRQTDQLQAMMVFNCKKCVKLRDSKWVFGDIRVFPTSQDDQRIIVDGRDVIKHARAERPEQLDWVGQ